MTIRKLSFFCFLALCSFRCAPSTSFFQVADVETTNARNVEGFVTFENDTIRVVYLLWSEGGVLGVFVHNKMSVPLYVDWKKCSYITGTQKHDYWDESLTISSVSSSATSISGTVNAQSTTSGSSRSQFDSDTKTEYWKYFWDPSLYSRSSTHARVTSENEAETVTSTTSQFLQTTFVQSLTRLTRPERVTFIPPGATISRTDFSLAGQEFTGFPLQKILRTDTTVFLPVEKISGNNSYTAWEPQKIQYSLVTFTSDNSPFTFRSFLTYSTDEKFGTESYINTSFFVSRVFELPVRAMRANPSRQLDQNSQYNMWATPHSFYHISKTSMTSVPSGKK